MLLRCFLLSFLFLTPLILSAQNADSLRNTYIQNRNNETSWNLDFLEEDLSSEIIKPMKFGAFPTPDYSSENPDYNGLIGRIFPGVQGLYKDVNGQRILYNSISVGKNSWNEERLVDRNSDLFFHIVVLTDSIDSETYTHLGSQTLSRNHPDYLLQGFFETTVGNIDYIAFQTANEDAFAIINMRLFDLSNGKTILIAPHNDGSFRSMQVDSPPLSAETVDAYTDELLTKESVVNFFTHPDAITWPETTD